MEVKEEIKNIIKEEIEFLITKRSGDFKKNYKKKIHNWILKELDEQLIAHMVFVSSFESKYGNIFQKISKKIARLKFGDENVPSIFRGKGITEEDLKLFKENNPQYNLNTEQIIISKLNPSTCQNYIAGFKEKFKGSGRGLSRVPSSLTQDKLIKLKEENFPISNEIYIKPVDLGFYNPKENKYSLIEIKAGGDLDSSNAPGNVIKMLTEYTMFDKENANVYFATLYHKNGEGNTWTGIVKQYLSQDLLLIGSDFWEKILPEGFSFEDLRNIYDEVIDELKINERINNLVQSI